MYLFDEQHKGEEHEMKYLNYKIDVPGDVRG
jgi:hypothetical protein